MKKIFYILTASFCLGMMGCQEDEALLFQDVARVQFTSGVEDYPYSFVWLDRSQESAIVKLPILVTGGPVDIERTVKGTQVEEFDVTYEYDNKGYVIDSTVTPKPNPAVAGVHYVPFNDSEAQALLKVKAAVVKDSLAIILKRDASLTTEKVRLRLRLEASDDLELGESKYLERTLVFSDMLELPSERYSYSNAYYYLGNYCVPKHELMIRVLKELQSSDSRVDDEWLRKGNADPTIFVYWRSKFVEELNAFNNNPENIESGIAPLRENPNDLGSALVTFPTKVN